jgi:hypothetical protein
MSLFEYQKRAGQRLRPYLRDLHSRVLVQGQDIMAYYAGFTTCVEYFGLTDRALARKTPAPVSAGRIGHQRKVAYEYLVKRRVHLKLGGGFSGMPQN